MICDVIIHPYALLLSECELEVELAGALRCPGVILPFWGELLEGSTPNPKPKESRAVSVYDPMIGVTINPTPEGPHKLPSQE